VKEKKEETVVKKTEEKKEELPKTQSAPSPQNEEVKVVVKVQSMTEELLCMKCGKPASRTKDITLSCTHCAHFDCLKE
jgi:hypothetical protein